MDGQRKALIVACDEYEHQGLRRLRSPSADAAALADVLSDRNISDFDVHVVRNGTSHAVQAEIEDLFLDARPDDVLLLHFSCHGLKSDSGELFFATRNTRPNRLGSTAIAADFVQRCMRSSRSRSIVVLLDCCYGGAFGEGVAVRAAGDVNVLDSFPGGKLGGGRGRAVITASNSMEYAFEGDRLADDQETLPSVFTSALVEGLATGEADRDEDGWIALGELYEYVFDRVRAQNANQTPSRDIEMQGELYLARSRRRRIRPVPIPADLKAATTDSNMFTRLGALTELRSRIGSDNLDVASGAYAAVAEIARADIQHVAEAAGAVLRDSAVGVSEHEVHFGQVPEGADVPIRTVRLLGPPLAKAGTLEISHEWIRAEQTADEVEVGVDAAALGTFTGSITIKSPTGEAVIAVTAEIVPAKRITAKAPKRPTPAPIAPPPQVPKRPRTPRLHRAGLAIAAGLTLVAGALLIAGLFPLYTYNYTLLDTGGARASLPLYLLVTAACALGSGGLCLIPRTRALIGPGVLMGAGAASLWGLTFLLTDLADEGAEDLYPGYALELTAHLCLEVAAVLAVVTVRIGGEVHLARRPRGDLAWLVAIVGAAGALALFFYGSNLYHYRVGGTWNAPVASSVAIVCAVLLPALAAVASPRLFGISLLAGWIAGAAAFTTYYHSITSSYLGNWIIVFTVSLGALVVLAVYFGRKQPS